MGIIKPKQRKMGKSIETMSAESIEDFIVRRCSEISGKEFTSIDTISIDLACQLAEEYAKQSKQIMKVELERKDLEALVKGKSPYYNEFDNPLVKKAGHRYSDQYGRTDWNSLSNLTDEELYELYIICKNSWDK